MNLIVFLNAHYFEGKSLQKCAQINDMGITVNWEFLTVLHKKGHLNA